MKKLTLFLSFCFVLLGCGKAQADSWRYDPRYSPPKPTTARATGAKRSPFTAYLTLKNNGTYTDKSAPPSRLCIDSLVLSFDKPINYATLQGKVYSVNQYKSKKPLHIKSHSPDFRSFVLSFPASESCPRIGLYKYIVVSRDLYNAEGKTLSQEVRFELQEQDGRTHLVRTKSSPIFSANANKSSTASSRQLWLNPQSPQFHWTGATSACGGRPSPGCLRVTPADLNRAFKVVEEWTKHEQGQRWYQGGLSPLPLEGTILAPYRSEQRKHQYGDPDIIFLLRRAAKFVSALFPQLQAIPIADLSNSFGQTPFASIGHEKIMLHPEGSHRSGKDVDVSYITTGGGHEMGGAYDYEKNFWFLYSILQSSSVDLVITAYKNEMLQLGRRAYESGLITDISLGRFNMLMEDANLNHDKHMHISARNAENHYKSQRFDPRDNVYNCYLALNPQRRGGNLNFCQ